MRKEKSRKIYTKLVFDMNTGEMLESESFDYAGPMALCEGGGSDDPPEWTETLPPDVRDWDEVKNSDSPEKFWDQMVNMRTRLGSSIRVPGKDAGEEDVKKFHERLKEKVPGLMNTPDFDNEESLNDLYGRMGRPAKAEDYVIPEFKNSKDEVIQNLDKTVIESFRERAFKAGLSQKQFNEAVAGFVHPNLVKYEQSLEAAKVQKEELAKEWGVAYDRNSKVVETFLKHTDAPEAIVDALTKGAVDRKSMLWFHKLASQAVKQGGDFQEDDSHRGVMTPDEAALKIAEIRNNKEHPYNNKKDPGHKAAMKHMRSLYELKNPKTGRNAAPGTAFSIGDLT